jgi:anaerobic ribonucleoside-triphosphate reductase activating protein
MIRLAGLTEDSITDGPGLRLTVFVQGCPRRCEGCHNPETWSFEGGRGESAEAISAKLLQNPLETGVTFSGGEPFWQAQELAPLARMVKGAGYELAVYTCYTFEELLASSDAALRALLALADVVVDGPFEKDRRNLDLKFRGSSNQRILDVKRSLAAGKAVWDESGRWS